MNASDPLQPPPLPPEAFTASAASPPAPKRNTLGLISLITLIVVTICTPLGICGIPLLVLIPLGLIAGLLALISLYKSPRWPGLLALLLLIICIIMWIATAIGLIVFGGKLANEIKKEVNRELDRTQARMMERDNTPSGPSPTADHIETLTAAAAALSTAAESQRNPDGSAPSFVNLSTPAGVPVQHQTDPWGFPYQYTLADSPRGYTFRSNGPDGIPGTSDDIDLYDLSSTIRKRKFK
ncbi:MAG: type II secretion system protein GspG [Planctomycetes bacterium]|nr:type II secretion system protein GspG [Planctomycetota bacterium]